MNREIELLLLTNLLNSIFSKFSNIDDAVKYIIENKNYEGIQKIHHLMRGLFPNITEDQEETLVRFAWSSQKKTVNNEKFQFVGTLPPNPSMNIRRTQPVMDELIETSRKNFLITGYSISEYSGRFLEKIKERAKCGVRIWIFINDDDELEQKVHKYINSDIRVFRYARSKINANSALHAKVAISDKRKALITSSNLSFNGFVNNIEIGTIVESSQVEKLQDTFIRMVEDGYFVEVSKKYI